MRNAIVFEMAPQSISLQYPFGGGMTGIAMQFAIAKGVIAASVSSGMMLIFSADTIASDQLTSPQESL